MSRKPRTARDTFRVLHEAHLPRGGVAAAITRGYLDPLTDDEITRSADEYRAGISAPSTPKPETGKVQTYLEKLAGVVSEIERRAKAAGIEYRRDETPGTCKELMSFLRRYDSPLWESLPKSLARQKGSVHAAGIRFLPGNNAGKGAAFYRLLFPETQ